MSNETPNRSDAVIEGFGEEWGHYDQASLSDRERRKIFDDYFHIFPWDDLPAGAATTGQEEGHPGSGEAAEQAGDERLDRRVRESPTRR